MKNTKRKLLSIPKKLLICSVSAVFILTAAVLIINHHVRHSMDRYILDPANSPQAEAVIVLGAYVFPDGTPSTMLRDRLDTGIELYKSGKAPKLVLTGDHGHKTYDEVNAMREYAQSKGVAREDIFMDHAGFNTYDSMYRARDVFLIRKMIVVTQEYHLKRALYISRNLGIETYGVCADKRAYLNSRYYNLREVAARFKDYVQVKILKPKPTFLGTEIPVWLDGRLTDDGKS